MGHLARVAERALRQITDALPGVAGKNCYGKFACLAFRDYETYYEYISYFCPEGEFGASGGAYLAQGYSHFVLNHAEHSSLEFVLVHELTHACLSDCPLPLWLEEGVTQIMEEAIFGHSDFAMNREELARHQSYWAENGLRCFWSGRSFQRPDDGMELSYVLAQVLTRNLLSRGRETFLRLLTAAEPLDCGDSATREIYGFGLGDLATHFLGEGDWGWTPVNAADFYSRAVLHLTRRKYAEATQYFEAALHDGEDPEHLNAFAWLLCTCPQDNVRDGSRAVALATRACELTHWRSEAILDTLGAAYAEVRDFARAVKWARAAVDLAADEHQQGDEARLRLYEAGEPYREDPGTTGDASTVSHASQ